MWVFLVIGAVVLAIGSSAFSDSGSSGGAAVANAGGGFDGFLKAFGTGLATAEGYFSSPTLASENNPGDLQATVNWAGMIGKFGSQGLAVFDSADDGWQALYQNLTTHVTNNPDQSLQDYIASYAFGANGAANVPADKQTAYQNYLSVVMSNLGISDPTESLSSIAAGYDSGSDS